MNTLEIINALRAEPGFVGCFARDQLPRRTQRPAGLVVNTDRSSEPGTHWCAYFIDASGRSEWFDPLGNDIPDNEILSFVRRNAGDAWQPTIHNDIAYQANTSWKCGAFCVFYLRKRLRGKSICEVYASLSRNPEVNEAIV